MSWANELYEIYERYCGNSGNEQEPLLPVSHSTTSAQIELTISENGEYRSAARVPKEDMLTIIPVTEKSGARSGKFPPPHPFSDKLLYLAGDYGDYVQGKRADNTAFFSAYTEQLGKWRDSEFSVTAVNALYTYIEKRTLMSDLIKEKVLVVDKESGKLDGSKINGTLQEDCTVRIRIEYSDINRENRTWCDKEIYDSFICLNSSLAGNKQLCYALGKEFPVTYLHPKSIIKLSANAKLISANDESGFSYRGRFSDKTEAASVSYEFSQKMHNALKWLIAKQGKPIDTLEIIVWDAGLNELPDVTAASRDIIPGFDMEFETHPDPSELDPLYKKKLSESVFGRSNKLKPDDDTMIMMLDSATPGRLSMIMYNKLKASDLINNISKWHSETAWYRYIGTRKTNEISSFSVYEIANHAFGTVNSKGFSECKKEALHDTAIRIVSCAVEGKHVPADIVNALVHKAENPLSYPNESGWRIALEAACGFYRKYQIDHKGRNYSMALDKECRSRDYLYGRLLAAADLAESSTYSKEETRTTNARNYFNSFANHPFSSWGVICGKLNPYFNKMNEGQRIRFQKLINEIMDKFSREDYTDNSKLSPEFLLGYHCQISDYYNSFKNTDKED